MRNPNGYGGVTKLSGKRRKPYRVRVTDGWEEMPDGSKKQKFKTIGYYATQKEALGALDAYHKNPEKFNATYITFGELYEHWSAQKFDPNAADITSESNIKGYKAAYKVCETLKDMKMADIKAAHLQDVIDKSGKNHPTLRKVRVLLSQLYGFAMANDIIDKDYSDFITIGKKSDPKLNRKPFTPDEIKKLWDNVDRHEWIDTVLILIYTGMRIGELLLLESANIFLDEKYVRGGSKTEAGKNRIIPLHNRIIPLIQKRYNSENKMFIPGIIKAEASYDTYRDVYWKNIMEQLQLNHLPHDTRHTFASLADSVGMNKLCIKRIMGHASSDLTDSVYTHKEIEELLKEVNKLP